MNPTEALDILNKSTHKDKDRALTTIITWYLQKVPNGEPFEHNEGDRYHLDYTDWAKIKPLIERLSTDTYLYATVSDIADCFKSMQNLNTQQTADMCDFLSELIETKLPDENNIQHEGYKIISDAEVLRIKQGKSGNEWNDLRTRAHSVTNAADRVFILTSLAGAYPGSKSWSRSTLLEAESLIKDLPTLDDKDTRLTYAAEIAKSIDKDLAIKFIKKAAEQMGAEDGRYTDTFAKNIIDLAYRIDPHLASGLITKLDDDPVRHAQKKELRARLQALKQADSKSEKEDTSPESNNQQAVEAIKIRLGRLHADKEKAPGIDITNKYLVDASNQPLSDTYWLFAYHVENARRKCTKGVKEFDGHVRDLFEGTMAAAEITWRVASRPTPRPIMASDPLLEESTADMLTPALGGSGSWRSWLQDHKEKQIVICDPYWDIEDLKSIKTIYELCPEVENIICIGGHPKYGTGSLKPLGELILDHWHDHVESNSNPNIELYHIWAPSSKRCPFHYRIIISGQSVLNLDTSIKSQGGDRATAISEYNTSEAKSITKLIESLMRREIREFEGERLMIEHVSL